MNIITIIYNNTTITTTITTIIITNTTTFTITFYVYINITISSNSQIFSSSSTLLIKEFIAVTCVVIENQDN